MFQNATKNNRVFSRKRQRKNPNNSSGFNSSKKSKKSKSNQRDSKNSDFQLPLRFLKSSKTKQASNREETGFPQSSRTTKIKSREESMKQLHHSPRSKRNDKSLSRIGPVATPASNFSMTNLRKPAKDKQKKSTDKRSSGISKTESLHSMVHKPKLKISSVHMTNSKKENSRSSDQTKIESSTDRLHGLDSRGNRQVRLTLNTCKSNAPLVQINNIVGDIKDSRMSRPQLQSSIVEGSKTGRDGSRSNERGKSRKNPSIEIALDSERLRISSFLKKNQAYDKKLIANYLQKNRLLNL